MVAPKTLLLELKIRDVIQDVTMCGTYFDVCDGIGNCRRSATRWVFITTASFYCRYFAGAVSSSIGKSLGVNASSREDNRFRFIARYGTRVLIKINSRDED